MAIKHRPNPYEAKKTRTRLLIAAVLIALTPATVACNPAQIQDAIYDLAPSFDQGAAGEAFWTAADVVISVGMELGIPFPF